mmetsp:Transcript_14767/g.40817  ORF Transcript_14767/g.40817 Transcript_14767/m.40817 type:complete len:208 (-) Transcript_14767:1132-1755(-)
MVVFLLLSLATSSSFPKKGNRHDNHSAHQTQSNGRNDYCFCVTVRCRSALGTIALAIIRVAIHRLHQLSIDFHIDRICRRISVILHAAGEFLGAPKPKLSQKCAFRRGLVGRARPISSDNGRTLARVVTVQNCRVQVQRGGAIGCQECVFHKALDKILKFHRVHARSGRQVKLKAQTRQDYGCLQRGRWGGSWGGGWVSLIDLYQNW